jgi:predicted amidohydrolase YtcJ
LCAARGGAAARSAAFADRRPWSWFASLKRPGLLGIDPWGGYVAQKRGLLLVCVVSLCGVDLIGQGSGDVAARLGHPDLIFYNGKIVTMDDASFATTPGTIVQALAVRGTQILATGTTPEVRALAGSKTHQVDLKGRTVLPSFILTHEHPTDWAWAHPEALKHALPSETDYMKLRWLTGSAQEQLAAWERTLAEMTATAKPRQWLWLSFSLGANFEHAEELFERFPKVVTREKLDELAPNNPVRVKNGWPLMSRENTRALEEIKRLHPGIETIGSEAAPRLVEPDAIMHGQTADLAKLLKAEMELWTAHGVTTFGSSPYNLHNLHALAYLDARGEMPARFAWGYTGPDFHEDTLRFVATLLGQGSDYLFNVGAWDSAGGTCTMLQGSPEVEARERCSFEPGSRGRESLERIVRTGGRIATMHTYGDKDIDYLMDAIEKGSAEAGLTPEDVRSRRHAFDHAMGAPRPDQLPRIKKLGMMVSMINTAIWENRAAYDASFRARDYGIEATKWSVPRRSVTEAGIMNSAEIDRPLPHKLFYNVWAGMTRYNEGRRRTFTPSEGTDRIVQLKALTTWGAHYLLRERKMGSLEPGKLADLVVLDRDYLTVPEIQIPMLRVLMTVVGGRIVHLRPELAQEIGIAPAGPVTWPSKPLDRYFIQPEVSMPDTP